ncbi:hypothetical protein [Mucilaginibacter paludis]|uniref:Uncharacterized protein n=1 Tax=Mucilaginibacter paludis DSM 18603 TaxID=714943 RepID=H1Y501_9SPHI|nr:hypothetical protein [Mucilaginibacter paludis]EHQ28329.1 hypothetical protein Mucpa_4238 [Mucilaginibacter paludis DSM 18603]
MKTKNEIEQLADETLASLDQLQQLEANSFLFAKIQSRMLYKNQCNNLAGVKTMSKLSVALALFIGLNIASYLMLNTVPKQHIKAQSSAAEALASEYHLNTDQYSY